ncbi:hypothetical protein Pmar_PMAR022044 [Perkinsus marinus ATCC 50983]|uniref:RRM domain-containing protein n=1 Tax=Perkinsus marinus (strain ATCC 50983 / TXsc) TaxID=423536 RepID=C5K996_PERM5|nr:hypothetical protein Pmar_PMAR022044 [Perkinsus marinus ATCC 50983]EER18937.1 hypothetical protein Pmar_PMAR022044 [Perkinsus marinus ATCC 50983]|eukprot:XP_002787141.1 hypothetical protein Pmar_PMAR022044 [Perkinsus marinus ATCC 50983]
MAGAIMMRPATRPDNPAGDNDMEGFDLDPGTQEGSQNEGPPRIEEHRPGAGARAPPAGPPRPRPPRAAARGGSRPAPDNGDGEWVQVVRRKPRPPPEEALKGIPKARRHLVITLATKLSGDGVDRVWPELTDDDIKECRMKLNNAVLANDTLKVIGAWTVKYGLALEVADQRTYDAILADPPNGTIARELPGKRTEIIIEGIPEEVTEEETLRRELAQRNGIKAPYEVVKISKRRGEKGGCAAMLRMDPEAAKVLLDKGVLGAEKKGTR